MKNWSKFLTVALAAGMLASCSRDEAGMKPVGPLGNEDAAYMSVEVSLPTQKGSRTATADATATEVGKDTENNVGTVMIVLAKTTDNTYLAHGLVGGLSSNGETTIAANAKIDRTDIQKLYNDDTHKALFETVRVFVFCNPLAEMVTKMEDLNAGEPFVDDICKVIENGTNDENLTIWSPNSFLMSNAAIAEREIPDKFDDWLYYTTVEKPFRLSGNNTDAEVDNGTNAGRGAIEVERAVARFDFRDGSPAGTEANTYEITTLSETKDAALKVKLVNMSLVNMSKEFYLLRRVSDDGQTTGANYAIGGKETTKNYIVDTDAKFKGEAVLDVKVASNKIGELKDHFNYPLYNSQGAITENTRRQWNTVLINEVLGYDEDNEGWANNKVEDAGGYHIWRYVTENTIPGDEDHQKTGLTTGIVFKGRLVADEALKDEETGHKSLYEAITGTYKVPRDDDGKPNAYTLTVDNKEYPTLYIFQDRIYVGWNDEVSKVAENEGSGSPLYVAAMTANDKGNPNELYQALIAADKTNNDAAVSEALAKFRAAATAAGFTIYQASTGSAAEGGAGYFFYYYAWNRHNDNGDNGRMGPMEFGVVRNNVYKLAVTKISRLGHPRLTDNDPDPKQPDDPDEDGDVYLTVSVKVLPWTVRVNNFEF